MAGSPGLPPIAPPKPGTPPAHGYGGPAMTAALARRGRRWGQSNFDNQGQPTGQPDQMPDRYPKPQTPFDNYTPGTIVGYDPRIGRNLPTPGVGDPNTPFMPIGWPQHLDQGQSQPYMGIPGFEDLIYNQGQGATPPDRNTVWRMSRTMRALGGAKPQAITAGRRRRSSSPTDVNMGGGY